MEYFEVPEANPGSDGICSDNLCPCGYPGATIPRGTGYMYISKEVVDFRQNARTVYEASLKIDAMRQSLGGLVIFDQGMFSSTLMCEQGARNRGLDLEVAAADAKHWWETGLCPLRPTPLAGQTASTSVAQQSSDVSPVRAIATPQADILSSAHVPVKSAALAAMLSFVLFGGTGQIYLGQWKKGLVLIVSGLFLITLGIGIPIWIIGVADAYGTGQKLENGEQVGEWQFNIHWKLAGFLVLAGVIFVAFLAIVSALIRAR
jgi:TM2 domain-containing membrane protein YozV